MVLQIADNVRQELIKLVPSSVFDVITCFVFFDNHPRDDKLIDVTVCTSAGEIIEYYKREVVCSLSLSTISKPSEVKILRNINCELFYLVVLKDEVLIVSRTRKGKLCLHRRMTNVDKYYIEDQGCTGQVCLKIVRKDDAVPVLFDDNFNNLGDNTIVSDSKNTDDSLPLLTQLMRKLTEAKYSVKCNEKTLNELLSLRQKSALASYTEVCPNSEDSVFKVDSKNVTKDNAPVINTSAPWVKLCNNKIIITLNLSYNSDEPLEDVHILLHGTSKLSIVYTTRIFKKNGLPPFWKEEKTRIIKNDAEIAVTAVVDFEEVKHALTNRIEFNGAMFYKKCGREYLVPFDQVFVSGEEISGSQFDALMSEDLNEKTCLAILASTIKTEMLFRHIRTDGPSIDMPKLFCTYLHMETVKNSKNVVLYRKSPYHALNGVMLIFEKNYNKEDSYHVTVHTRSPSQVTTLMYLVHATIPHQIVMTTENQKITAKKDELSKYNESLVMDTTKLNFKGYGASIVNQSNIILEYLDTCMMKMGSKNMDKIGKEIDLYSPGTSIFNEFKKNMLGEAAKGIKSFVYEEKETENMEIG